MSENDFWESSLETLRQGVKWNPENRNFHCLICGKEFLKGQVFYRDGNLYDAEKSAELHVTHDHGGMFSVLRNMDKRYTGLTENQKRVLSDFYLGLSDEEVSKKEGISNSTVRQYRFAFREKAREAKIFLALWELASFPVKDDENLISFPRTAEKIDQRYAITEKEHRETLEKYFKNQTLKNFPKKEKQKLSVLKEILNRFEKQKNYTEKEVNEILSAVFQDHVTLRRYLIEYGFLDRKDDGSVYWVKN